MSISDDKGIGGILSGTNIIDKVLTTEQSQEVWVLSGLPPVKYTVTRDWHPWSGAKGNCGVGEPLPGVLQVEFNSSYTIFRNVVTSYNKFTFHANSCIVFLTWNDHSLISLIIIIQAVNFPLSPQNFVSKIYHPKFTLPEF